MVGPVFAVLFAAMLGIASIFSRRGLEHGSYYALLVISLAVGSAIFTVITFLTTGFADTPIRGVIYTAVGAVFGSVVGRALYFLGIEYLGPGKALSINATSPLYAAMLAWLVLGETITPLVVLGTLTVVVGIVVLSKDIRTQTEQEDHSVTVVVYPLVGALMGAISVILRKIALDTDIAPIEAITVNMVVGFLVASPLLATRLRGEIVDIDRRALGNFVVASTIMAVGLVFYFEGLQSTNASIFYPLVQTQPLFAVVFSALLLRQLEIITRWSVLGSIIVVVGATLVIIG